MTKRVSIRKKCRGLKTKRIRLINRPIDEQAIKESYVKRNFRASCHSKYLTNPGINHFNIHSKFIFDIDEIQYFWKKYENKKLLLVNESEKNKLNDIINELQILQESEKQTDFINLPQNILVKLKNFVQIKKENCPLRKFIEEQFSNNIERDTLSCRNLANLYQIKTGNKTNRTTINKIIKNELGYRYLKTVAKDSKTNKIEHKLISLAFIKIIVRSILLNFTILYCDETYIYNKNINYRIWRKREEHIYQNYKAFAKKNIIMTISKDDIIYYEILEETTNSDTFLKYMENLKKIIDVKKIDNYLIVMDNLSSHKTPSLIKFYYENCINIVFNSPKMSFFNAIELAFRAIKNKLYKKLFYSISDVEKKISEIIQDEKFKINLLNNYKETLIQYYNFIENNKNLNLNNFNI